MSRERRVNSWRTNRATWKVIACAALPLPMLAACGGPGQGDEPVESSEIGTSAGALGTIAGTSLTNQHLKVFGSESVISTRNTATNRHAATFNTEDSSPFVEYSDTDRFITRSASLLGWTNWRTDGVVTAEGRLRPPAGWAVLWGDPAIERNRANSNFLYIANLGIPDNKFPSSGVIQGSVVTDNNTRPDLCGSFIGGACIARSTDDGQTFTVSSQNCIKRTDGNCPNGHFYDGSSLAPTFNVSGGVTTGTGRMFAAFNDVTRGRHDVYQQQIIGGGFSKVTDFSVPVVLHPRLRYGRTQPNAVNDNGALYMLYEETNGRIGLARYDGGGGLNGAWTIATWTTPVVVTNNDVQLNTVSLRTGPEYDFDIGYNDSNVQEIRIVYSVTDSAGRHHMNGASCAVTFPAISCSPKGLLWSTGFVFPNTQQWNPRISFGKHPLGGDVWHISFYHSVAGTNNVELWKGRITNTSMGPLQRNEESQTACPDNRGYWGDYDNMVPSVNGLFLRPFTDSAHGTCVRRGFTSSPILAALSGWPGR